MKKSLNKTNDIRISTWLNSKKITDSNWNVFVSMEDDDIFLFVKDEKNNELKIQINKYIKETTEPKKIIENNENNEKSD